jgi:hypothetical protein
MFSKPQLIDEQLFCTDGHQPCRLSTTVQKLLTVFGQLALSTPVTLSQFNDSTLQVFSKKYVFLSRNSKLFTIIIFGWSLATMINFFYFWGVFITLSHCTWLRT